MRSRVRRRRLLAVLILCALGVQGCAVPRGLAAMFDVSSWVDRQSQDARAEALREQGRRDASAPMSPKERDEDAYRQGIREALARMQRNGGIAGAASSDPHRLLWIGPVMQEVWVPSRVVNGVMVPEHRTWVVVTPGRWGSPEDAHREQAVDHAPGGVRPARYQRGPSY
jgi:hypothetical protein